MNTYDMTCPKCGATMKLNEKDERLRCPYCNHEIMVELEDTPDEIREKEYAKSYGYHSGKYKAEKEYGIKRKKESKKSVGIVIWVVVILLFMLCLPCILGALGIFVAKASRPEINPFEYIEVSFVGTDGRGELVITELVNEEIAVDAIRFEASQEGGLSVGDKVRITASSIDYELEEEVKIYTVEGLEEYIKNLDTLSQEELDVIHSYAENELGYRISSLKEAVANISYKPVKLFLITDEKSDNVLYDVYEFNISTESENATYYTVVSFQSAMIQKTEPITMDYWWSETAGKYNRLESGVRYYGYDSIDEVRTYVTSEMESGMRLKELDL
ncbi:MAG: hypothetical protein E7292_09985 [Lachnospiraceae bacterium]|nr:hypothetical protein [Lachnospiraceae bacterium]